MSSEIPPIIVIRAMAGEFAKAFRYGNYVGIGFTQKKEDLSRYFLSNEIADDILKQLYINRYKEQNSDATPSNQIIGQQVSQMDMFLQHLTEGAFVLTPGLGTDLHIGIVETGEYYFDSSNDSPYPHRKKVRWFDKVIYRDELSGAVQSNLTNRRTVFTLNDKGEILSKFDERFIHIGEQQPANKTTMDYLLSLEPTDFEKLIANLMTSLGFVVEHRGGSGDGGIDITGTFSWKNFLTINVYVQVKNYKGKRLVNASEIRDFRGAVPSNTIGVFVTSTGFHPEAEKAAKEPYFQPIYLLDGKQVAELVKEEKVRHDDETIE